MLTDFRRRMLINKVVHKVLHSNKMKRPSTSIDNDGPDEFDCPHAHAARMCGCGFCMALNTPKKQTRRELIEALATAIVNGER